MIELREMTPEEVAAAEVEWQREAADRAEHLRLVKTCAETNGGHAWELHLDDPEDDTYVAFHCERCPADIGDLIHFDYTDLLYAELEDGIEIAEGRHNSPVALIVPVEAEVWSSKHWTDYGWDYDAGVEISQRGPARPMFPEVTE